MTKNHQNSSQASFRIDQVTTKTGDQGQTSVADGKKISKDCDLIETIGNVDELNSSLGLLVNALSHEEQKSYKKILLSIQNQLFNLGSELAIPPSCGFSLPYKINQSDISDLELEINLINQDLPALQEFILPGGTMAASTAHLSRSICRRAERSLVTLIKNENLNLENIKNIENIDTLAPINPYLLIYLNRLSDFLFVLSRALNIQAGQQEILWIPKK